MNWQLHAIERPCTRIPGALKSLVLVDPNDLSEQPFWPTLQSVDALVFKSGKAGYAFEQDRLTAQLTAETDISNDAGDVVSYALNASFRNIRSDWEFLRAKFLNRRIHILATYMNDLQRFVPYMRLRTSEDSGRRLQDRNGYTVSGSARLSTPAPLLDSAITVSYPDGVTVTPPSTTGGGVTTASDTTTGSTYTYEVPAGKWLVGVYVRSDQAQTVSLGTTPGGDELGGTLDALANEQILFQCNNFRPLANTNIYLSGLAGTNTIEIWLLG